MKHRIAAILTGAVAIALLGTVPAAGAGSSASGPAPQFNLESRGGPKISLAQYKGQVVMLNFWQAGADRAGRKCRCWKTSTRNTTRWASR